MTTKKVNSSFDFSSIDYSTRAEEGEWLDIVDASGESTGLEVKVLGKDSKAFKEAQNADLRRKQKIMKRTGRKLKNVEDLHETERTLAVGASAGWRFLDDEGGYVEGFPPLDEETAKRAGLPAGQIIPFSRSNAVKLYAAFPIFQEQIFEFSDDRQNFTAAS